ncbi:hypothetical protein AOQ84DRAFT_337951 [Glonium stellatum]|uniref:Conserved oligomeric Golgi complex subunit 1 n=1 Tax=Glonium stellatum TaxID=574774 RepID=A0A8E2F3U9_9PEZI|nr:hypothetical protein AOQ84DRAFT_337951 [Glonium stellatum]
MEGNMEQIETTLGKVGQKCNSRAVDRISDNYAKLDGHWRARDRDRYAFASQLSILQSCPVVMARLLKKGGSSLLIAKVLVLSRLLHKALSQAIKKPPFVDNVRDQLASQRRRLLSRIDRHLSGSTADTSTLVENMCAFSLATSSTPTDVLRHFHHIRMEAIAEAFKPHENVQEHILNGLKLCVQTLQDTQAIFPRRLADSLAKLKSHPLMQDPEIRAIAELNLDIHERWIVEEARNYTPWPRHDELKRADAEGLLKSWAKHAISSFLKSMKDVLSNVRGLKAVAELRRQLLETWLASGSGVPGLKSIVHVRAQGLHSITSEISKTLENWPTANREVMSSLWDSTITSMAISNGAESFKQEILNTSHGRNGSVLHIVSMYQQWANSVLETKRIIKEMREIRWDEDFGGGVDDSDDEFGLDPKQALLSEDDPHSLEEKVHEALSGALLELQKNLKTLIARLTSDMQESSLPKAIFLLRVLREVSERIPRLGLKDTESASPPTPFTPSLVEPLHNTLATVVSQSALASLKKSLRKISSSQHVLSRILWEGNPPLPVQPSPGTFKFLHTLSKDMGVYGGDLWAPGAVRMIKGVTGTEVYNLLKECANSIQAEDDMLEVHDEQANGIKKGGDKDHSQVNEESTTDKGEVKKEMLTQLFFDISYLQLCLSLSGHNSSSDEPFDTLLEATYEAANLDEASRVRLRKSAADYRKRTYLLFALLC